MKRAIVAIALIFGMSCLVFAVDLVNKDSTSYEVKIHDVGTTHSSIEGNTTKASICSDCEIEVVGVGTIKASGSERIIIEGGKLTKE